jgi:hypothetical protein
VIYLIVLGFAAARIAAMLFFCGQTNAGNAFHAIGGTTYVQGIFENSSRGALKMS